MYEITCKICGVIHQTENYRKLVCNKSRCNAEYERLRKEKCLQKEYHRVCKVCNKNFSVIGSKECCCSEECHKIFYNEKTEKAKITNFHKYGVDSPNKSKVVQKRKEKSYMKNLGVSNPSNLQRVRDKISSAYNNKSDEQKQNIEEKRKATCKKLYDVEYSLQNKEVRDKASKRMLEKYNVIIPMQNEELFNKCNKSGLSFKPYTLPSGRIIYIQGYEYRAFNYLLSNGYSEFDIISHPTQDTVGKFYYEYNNTDHRYYPDFFIPKENLIIEVKSDYLYFRDLQINLIKKEACLKAGYNFKFYVYNKQGDLLDIK